MQATLQSLAHWEARLIGMTWPKQYGGQDKSFLERYVVTEELPAAGAPVGCHWIATVNGTTPAQVRY